jgi:plastocyanin
MSAAPSTSPAAAPSGAGASVTIKDFAFGPATLTVKAGTAVTWTNQDAPGHTVTFDSGGVSSDTLRTGATFSHTFASAGTFTYHCAIHPSMKGSITVTS